MNLVIFLLETEYREINFMKYRGILEEYSENDIRGR